jgi:hypothetical protein
MSDLPLKKQKFESSLQPHQALHRPFFPFNQALHRQHQAPRPPPSISPQTHQAPRLFSFNQALHRQPQALRQETLKPHQSSTQPPSTLSTQTHRAPQQPRSPSSISPKTHRAPRPQRPPSSLSPQTHQAPRPPRQSPSISPQTHRAPRPFHASNPAPRPTRSQTLEPHQTSQRPHQAPSSSFNQPQRPSFNQPQKPSHPSSRFKNVQVRKKQTHSIHNAATNPYDVQDVDPLFEQYNFDVQGNLQRKFNPFPFCSTWTKRDVKEVFDNADDNPYEAGHFYALFHLLLGLPEINCQDSEALARASRSTTERLELWQLGNQFDLIYYMKEQRIFRIHIDKKQIYEPTKLFPLRTNERTFPTIHDEDRMNLTTYCLFLKQKITSKIKNLF